MYALSPETGEVIWDSEALEGACSGTPVISEDGAYVFLTHNLLTIGHFSILAAAEKGAVFYSQLDPNQPYGPPGIYYNPLEGYYAGGQGNTNDIVMWAYRPKQNESSVGLGSTFAFQFPVGFSGTALNLAVSTLALVTWQTITAPRLFNDGYSMMWGIARSEFRSWNGAFGDSQHRFDKAATSTATFPRGEPKSQAVFAALEFSSDPTKPMAFGGAASNVIAGFDYLLTEMWRANTTFPVYAEARISPDDETVYFVEQNGRVHAIEATTGKVRWSAALGGVPTTSNFALSRSGKMLYFNNQAGILQAWQVADGPSPAPSSSPSSAGSIPTAQPSRGLGAPSASLEPVAPSDSTPTIPSNSTNSTTSDSPSVLSSTAMPSFATPEPTLSPSRSTRPPTTTPTTSKPTSSAVSYGIVSLSTVMAVMVTLLL